MSDEKLKEMIVNRPNEFAEYLRTEGMSERVQKLIEELQESELDGKDAWESPLSDLQPH